MPPPSRTTTREPAPSTKDTASQPRITHLNLRSHHQPLQLQGSSTISPQASSLQHPPVVRPIERPPRPRDPGPRDALTNHCTPLPAPHAPAAHEEPRHYTLAVARNWGYWRFSWFGTPPLSRLLKYQGPPLAPGDQTPRREPRQPTIPTTNQPTEKEPYLLRRNLHPRFHSHFPTTRSD